MNLCIVGGKKTESNLRLLEEGKKLFDSVLFVPISGIRIGLEGNFSIKYRTTDLLKFDCVLPRIPHRLYSYGYQLLSLLPKRTFVPIRPISFLIAEERFFLLSMLRKREMPTIDIYLTRSSHAAYGTLQEINFPVIIRTPNKKTGMVVKNISEARSVIDAMASLKEPMLLEDVINEFVSVYVSQPDVIGCVKKVTKEKDMLIYKGQLHKYEIDSDVEKLALDVADTIESHLARVDISLEPKPKVVNVDLNPSLVKASEALGVNLAKKAMENIHNNYKENEVKQKPLIVEFIRDAKSVVRDLTSKKSLI